MQIKKFFKYLFDKKYRFIVKAGKNKFNYLNDELYIKKMFYARLGKQIDLVNPKTFNEKMQWLKLNDRKPLYSKMVDKFEVKKYIDEVIGNGYTIPTIGIWDDFDDINFDDLPNQFVLKCTHDSGGLIICKDKSKLNIALARKKIKHCLNKNFYYYGREWPYKNVKPRIIAEPYMVDESGVELKDYKIFCFNGVPEYIEVDFNRFIKHKLNTYDFDWNPLNFGDKSENDYSANINKPNNLDLMRNIAKKLSENMKFLRVDFYNINGIVYIGELTLYPGSGFIQYNPENMDLKYGELLLLED